MIQPVVTTKITSLREPLRITSALQFSSSTVPPTALHHGSSVRASVASPFLSTSNRREDVGTRPAHRLYDHQKCMRILGQNASALTLRRLNIITTEEYGTSRPPGRGKWRADPARATNEPTSEGNAEADGGGGRTAASRRVGRTPRG